MPLHQIRKIYPHVFIGFWHITESPAELLAMLENLLPGARPEIPAFTSQSRQRQWLASRLLAYLVLQKFTPEIILLQTAANGKPVFSGSAYQISISHCQDRAAVIVSNNIQVGIDIETISPKVMRIADKFMTETEKTDAAGDTEKTLVYWSGKETLYKLYSKKQLIFKENLFINAFTKMPAGTTAAQIITPDCHKEYALHYEIGEKHILTYAFDV